MDLTISYKSSVAIWNSRAKTYTAFGKLCEKNQGFRLLGGALWAADHALLVAQTFADIGEKLVKGYANIFAAPFMKNAKVLTGISQLGMAAFHSLTLPLLPVHFAISYFVVPARLVISGKKYTDRQVQYLERRAINQKLSLKQLSLFKKWEKALVNSCKKHNKIKLNTLKVKHAQILNNEKIDYKESKNNLKMLQISREASKQMAKELEANYSKKRKDLIKKYASAIKLEKAMQKKHMEWILTNHYEQRKKNLSVKELNEIVQEL